MHFVQKQAVLALVNSNRASGIFEDEVGNTLVTYFGRRVKAEVKTGRQLVNAGCYNSGPKAPSALGQLLTCLDQAERDRKKVFSDGLKDDGPLSSPITESEDHQSFTLGGIEYIYQDKTFTSETTSVLYLVHSWPDQANDATKKYKKAFNVGKWTAVDPSPFLDRVIVWKLSVSPHQDGLDEGPAVIFLIGHFKGSECYIPDLKLKLS
ncbi:hypothetical protein EDD22DRAFT_848521 [Suillus occidentalis]|nr:hypothetical protein EDD22DRAFT_848521 [Suillus occidentalis]